MTMTMRFLLVQFLLAQSPTYGATRWTTTGRRNFVEGLQKYWQRPFEAADCFNQELCRECWLTNCFEVADVEYNKCMGSTPEADCDDDAKEKYNECGKSCAYCAPLNKGSCESDQIIKATRFRTDTLYNDPAPNWSVAFIIGGIIAFMAMVHWLIRFSKARSKLDESSRSEFGVLIRAALVTMGDDDEPLFTVLRTFSQGFLLLGGFQLDYHLTVVVLVVGYAILALRDSIRVLIAYYSNKGVESLVAVCDRDRANLSEPQRKGSAMTGITILHLETNNVYENLSRGALIVALVFITQAALVGLVVTDLYKHWASHKVPFGTETVPIVSTMGSYLTYILGMFMQCVYLLGPQTRFGMSEQNPHYWVQLLLIVKGTGAICSWRDNVKNKTKKLYLKPNRMAGLWIRFFLSYLINGAGFYILVHSLPVQVAAQNNLTAVVIRAVGLFYIIGLDDTPSMSLMFREGTQEQEMEESKKSNADNDDGDKQQMSGSTLDVNDMYAENDKSEDTRENLASTRSISGASAVARGGNILALSLNADTDPST